VTATTD